MAGERREWRNWAGDQRCRPTAVETPANRDELVAGVERAGAAGRRLRVAASGHSFTDIALTDDVMLRLDSLDSVLDVDAASGLVRVEAGMSEQAVRRLFGEPDRIRDVSLSPGPPPQTDWIWDVPGGTVTLKFDNSVQQLSQYATDSPRFESAAGVSVGDSIKPVLKRYEGELVESPLGTGALVLSQDAPGSSPALVFSLVQGGNRIVEISGGAVVQPAGE